MQTWTAWIRTTWAIPEGSRSMICRRRWKTAKQTEINQNDTFFTSQNTKIFKIRQLYKQNWTAWIRTIEPSRKAPEARFVGVAEWLQDKRKSTKMTIYSHHKTPKASKYVSFINKLESPELAQLEPLDPQPLVSQPLVSQPLDPQPLDPQPVSG